jgi:phosphatidylethanolamine/phosphatidyl-N-methylethanolamine N-methyltransferase
MDAEHLSFPDASFDAVVAMYVATVAPNPARVLSEMARVCVPGGPVIVVNHFASQHPLLRAAERALTPLSKLVGFRTALPLEALPQPEALERLLVEPVNALGLWKIVHYRRRAVAKPARHERAGHLGKDAAAAGVHLRVS